MKNVTCQASQLRYRRGPVPARGISRSVLTFNCGTQITTAKSAGTAQMPSEYSHPPNHCSSGTATPAAIAAPPDRAVEYKPIMLPALTGKWRLIRPGKMTMTTLIARPRKNVPTKSPKVPSTLRSAIPRVRTIRLTNTIRSGDCTRSNWGANGANTPKHSTGRVNSTPSSVPDRPRPTRIESITGPTPISGARRFNDTYRIVTSKKMLTTLFLPTPAAMSAALEVLPVLLTASV